MNDQELRALVRDAVARHLGGATQAPRPSLPEPRRSPEAHPSHALYLTLVTASDSCLMESAVPCTHCGYCQSHGH